MLIQDLPPALRPRDKLLALGPEVLTDGELLAVLLRTGLPGQSVLVFAHDLLRRFEGLAGLLQASPQSLQSVKGLGGNARRAQLAAVLELSRRVCQQRLRERDVLASPEAARQLIQLQLGSRAHEVFAVLFLDAQNRLLRFAEMFTGTLNQTSVYPREVVKLALELGANALILAHNHPSGQVLPSPADVALTRALSSALALVDVRVLDHIIVAPGHAYSMAEKGQM